jgi:K+-transporting ATPase ATPase C chain
MPASRRSRKPIRKINLVTASASGLDPHISRAAADYQLSRVALARGMKQEAIKALVEQYTEKPGFGLLGDPYVNIVKLNLALDEASGAVPQDSGKKK